MNTYEEKLKAINLYFKYESYSAALNELGYHHAEHSDDGFTNSNRVVI